jgi:O-antigen/teichoic acid export membrane protein
MAKLIPVRLTKLWRQEWQLRTRLVNIGHLLTGNVFSSLIGLLAFALTARALGPIDYGLLALVYTYIRAIERLVSFQSWQPLIKYGADLQNQENHPDLKSLLKFGLLLDIAGAILGWAMAIVFAMAAARFLDWEDRTINLILVYSTLLLFRINGMPTAVLRLAGRFRLMAYQQLAGAAFRLTLCVIGVAIGGDVYLFALIWLVSQIFGSLLLLAFSLRELHKQGVRGLIYAPLRGVTSRFQGLWNFAWSANLSLTIRSSAYELDTLLVGVLAGPAAAGLYHIAKRVGRLAQQVGAQVQAVLYPDVARLWAHRAIAEFRRAVIQVEVLLASFGLAAFVFFFFAAEPLVRWSAGPEFAGATPLIVVQMLAATLTLTGMAVRSALLAMGRHRQVLAVVLIGTVAFHCSALVFIPRIGAMGANLAHIVLGMVWVIGLTMVFRRDFRRATATNPSPHHHLIQ